MGSEALGVSRLSIVVGLSEDAGQWQAASIWLALSLFSVLLFWLGRRFGRLAGREATRELLRLIFKIVQKPENHHSALGPARFNSLIRCLRRALNAGVRYWFLVFRTLPAAVASVTAGIVLILQNPAISLALVGLVAPASVLFAFLAAR